MGLLLTVDGIDVLELNYDVGVCVLEEVLNAWKKIQERKSLIACADTALEEFEHIVDELSPAGLSLQTLSPTMEAGSAKNEIWFTAGRRQGPLEGIGRQTDQRSVQPAGKERSYGQ